MSCNQVVPTYQPINTLIDLVTNTNYMCLGRDPSNPNDSARPEKEQSNKNIQWGKDTALGDYTY